MAIEKSKVRIYLAERPQSENPSRYTTFFGAEVKKNPEARFPGAWYCDFDFETFLASCVSKPGLAIDIMEHSNVVGASTRITMRAQQSKRFQDGSIFIYWITDTVHPPGFAVYDVMSGSVEAVVRFSCNNLGMDMAEMPEHLRGYATFNLGVNRPTIWDVLGNTFPRIRWFTRRAKRFFEEMGREYCVTFGRR